MRKYPFIFFTMLSLAIPVYAHVGYVVDRTVLMQEAGVDVGFLTAVLTDPFYVGLMLLTAVAVLGAIIIGERSRSLMHLLHTVGKRLDGYQELIPWMVRLSLGIALIGAGTSDVLVSPIVSGAQGFALAEVLVGFLLLTGFLVPLAALGAIFIFLEGLNTQWYLLGNLDFLALAIVLLVLGDGRPGVDDILGLRFLPSLKKAIFYVPLILRIGIGIAMTYLAIYEKFLNPHWSAAVVTQYHLDQMIPVSVGMWVLSAGIIEFLVGAALLIGLRTRFVSVVAFAVLSLSFFYFHEAVYSHITLFGTLSVLLVTGGGKWSIDYWLFKKR